MDTQSSSSIGVEQEAYGALLDAQASGDVHAEAIALRAVGRIGRKPDYSTGRSDLERFWCRLVFGLSDCWIWLGGLTHLGYGAVGNRIAGERSAHRLAFRLFKGDIPKGLEVMHSCDVRCCVNPDHLSLGTHAENMQDMARKGRGTKTGCAGERNGMARLTAAAVAEIRRLKSEGAVQAELARRFGVSPMTVSRIVRGEQWR